MPLFDGTDVADTLQGTDGDDTVRGFGGDDLIIGGLGVDSLFGNDGADIFRFTAIRFSSQTTSPGLIDGGSGIDTLDLRGISPTTLGTIQLADSSYAMGVYIGSQRYEIRSVEILQFGGGDDTLSPPLSWNGSLEIRAGAGKDSIFFTPVSGTTIKIFGEDGADTIFLSGSYGYTFSGIADGGTGDDSLHLNINASLDLATGTAVVGQATYSISAFEKYIATTVGYNSTFRGGLGNDTFFVSSNSDDGRVGVYFDGREGSDSLSGSNGADTLIGGSGNDFLDGRAGIDRMEGGIGDDIYVIDRVEDLIIENVGGGSDTVVTSFSYSVGGNIENATVSRGDRSIVLIGDAGSNVLTGAADSLADTLSGGLGDDFYVLHSMGSVIVERENEGFDTIVVTSDIGSYQLAAGMTIEQISASQGSASINIAGNGFAQVLNGNDGANILSTGGGGPDTLNGGLGDDTYRVFETGDVIIDIGGNDILYTSGTSYFLYSTAAVETLSTSLHGGTESFYLVGNGASQLIIGNYGDNVVNGRSGNGEGNADTIIGLYGNDTFAVFLQGDVVREAVGQGFDTVVANTNYQLRDGTEIENLTVNDQNSIDAAQQFTLRGNEFAQTLVGNDTVNVLDGRGGNDLLIGRGGNDMFAFTTALGAGNVDRVQDFATGDKIGLASDVFAAVTEGGIAAGEFVLGTAAADADDRLVYEQASGKLWYDVDGNGAGTAVQFAQLGAGAVLGVGDFVVVAPVGSLAAA